MDDGEALGMEAGPGPAGIAALKEKVPLLLNGGIVPDVAEPEGNRGDDPDSCLQYTVNAVSGERQAPPKTEDGTDTEEVESSLACVYVRIHTGSSLPLVALKTGEVDPLLTGGAAAAADEAGTSNSAVEPADGTSCEVPASASASAQGQASAAAAAAAAAVDEATSAHGSGDVGQPGQGQAAATAGAARQATANWEEVYQDVLQKIYSCRESAEEPSGSPQDAAPAHPDSSQQQQQQQQQDLQQQTDAVLDRQAAHLAAHAIASACTEPQTPAQRRPSSAAAAAAAGSLQDSSVSGLRTPVVLPPDAADLPMQAVLDELDTLLAKSDELRSSVQLRSSRQGSGQHTSTHLSCRSSFSVLDRPLTAVARSSGSSARHSRHSTDWEEAGRSSRRRSNSQPPAMDRGEDGSSGSRGSGLQGHGDVDIGDRFDRTLLDSTEVRDEIMQHLQMITGGKAAPDQQDAAGHRDASTSVGGLSSTPRQAEQQHLPASGLSQATAATGEPSTQAPSQAGAAGEAPEPSPGLPHRRGGSGDSGPGSTGGARRSSGSRCGGGDGGTATDACSSMDKLHALYARFLSDTASARSSSAGDGVVQQGGSSTGVARQSRRLTGGMSSIGVAPAAAPMRSSMPFPLAAMAGTKQPEDGVGTRRCRSVSPQKDPQRHHALSHNTLQEHEQQQQQQHSCAYQLQHCVSLCSSCGGPLQRETSVSSRACSAALQAAAAVQPAAAGLGAPASAADSAAMGIRTVSDMLPSTHISISSLMAHELGSTSSTTQQLPAGRGTAPAAAASALSPQARGRAAQRMQGELGWPQGGRGGGEGGTRSASPLVRGGRGGRGGSYSGRLASSPAHAAAVIAGGAPARRAASSSPDHKTRRALGASPLAGGGSDVILSSEGVGVTAISFGQLLQETALQQAMGQLQLDVGSVSSVLSVASAQASPVSRFAAAATGLAAATPDSAAQGVQQPQQQQQQALLGAVQEGSPAVQVLNTVPEDGVINESAAVSSPPRRTHSRSSSMHRLLQLPPQLEIPAAVSGIAGAVLSSPVAAAAAAAALQELAQAADCAEPQLSQVAAGPAGSLSPSYSLHSDRNALSRCNSSGGKRCLTASVSLRSRTSSGSLSSSGSRVWRPGGNRTDPKDDFRKLQTYESARLRALQKQGLLSPGCSMRALLPADMANADPAAILSPRSRRSTTQDLATPVSPGPPSISVSAPASPHAGSPGGYTAGAAARRRPSAAAAAAAGGGAGSPSPGRPSPQWTGVRPGSATAHRAATARPAGPKSVLEPVHTAISLTGLINGSPPAPQRCASPRLRKQQPLQQQQSEHEVWQSLTGKPCPPGLLPMLQRLQQQQQQQQQAGAGSGPGHKAMPQGSVSAHTSPDRARRGAQLQHPASRSCPSSGNSTTAQVEEAIRAAQAALLQQQQQVSQVRQALPGRQGAAARAQGLQASRSVGVPAARRPLLEQEDALALACAEGLTDSCVNSSFWGGSSNASSYTGKRASRDLAAAAGMAAGGAEAAAPAAVLAAAIAAAATAAGQQHARDATAVSEASAAHADLAPSSPGSLLRHAGSGLNCHAAVKGLAALSAPVQAAAVAAAEAAAKEPGTGGMQQAEEAVAAPTAAGTRVAAAPYAVMTVQASPGSPSSGRKPGPAAAAAGVRSPAECAAGPRLYKGPVVYHSRHRSHSPKKRPVSALEELLGVAPLEEAEEQPLQQVRPRSAGPVLPSQLAAGLAAAGAAAAVSGRRAAGGHSSRSRAAPQLGVQQARARGGSKGRTAISIPTARRSSCGGGGGGAGYIAEPWSAPLGRNAAGLTGEQLLAQHRRSSAAEAAEAAAAAAQGDAEAAECVEHAMPLDVLVRAYAALHKKNNTSERAAAVAMLLGRIAEGNNSHVGAEGGSGARSNAQARSPGADPAGAAAAVAAAQQAGGASGGSTAQQAQPKLRSGGFPGADSLRLDVLGRGLSPVLPAGPDSPGAGSLGGPSSPSAIIKTLKEDSLLSWQRCSPERQAAHATLLATPKHKHASSYAADLAALAAGSSSTNLHAEKSVHRNGRTDSPAGGRQPAATAVADNPAAAAAPGSSAEQSPPALHSMREGSVTGVVTSRGCTPLRGVSLSSSSGNVVADTSPPTHQQVSPSPLHTQPEGREGGPGAHQLHPLVDTATGRAVLASIGAHDMTVAAALTWLKAGLQSPDTPAPSPRQRAARAASPKRLSTSRPCSPFGCFGGGRTRGMARSSSDDEADAAAGQQGEEAEAGAGVAGVTFEMGADNRLVMVVRQPGVAAPQRLRVTGVRLHGVRQEGSADAVGSSGSRTLDLVTSGGSHTIELATESDWAGLVVGLNAMLLLLEQAGPEGVERVGALPMKQAAWSIAVSLAEC